MLADEFSPSEDDEVPLELPEEQEPRIDGEQPRRAPVMMSRRFRQRYPNRFITRRK